MVSTAYRSCLAMRKLGWFAEVVEHRRGSFIKVDCFGFGDVLAYKPNEGIMMIQAYHAKEEKNHIHLNSLEAVKNWILAGGRFSHHLWNYKTNNKRKFWHVEMKEIKLENCL